MTKPLPDGVEQVQRGDVLFVLNHGAEEVSVGKVTLAGRDAAIVRA